jgi:AcrR family transcriptional regulator
MTDIVNSANETHQPPGRVKIVKAFKELLAEKEFGAVTTAEIARNAGVTEALIYKYFRDKRDLLHQILADYLKTFGVVLETDLKGIKGALNQLRKLIWSHINVYTNNRVFAKVLLIEVRNYPDYYRSDTYELVKIYSNTVLSVIESGVRDGEIRSDIPAKMMRQTILGSIEHVCLSEIVFEREMNPEEITGHLCEILFDGIRARG